MDINSQNNQSSESFSPTLSHRRFSWFVAGIVILAGLVFAGIWYWQNSLITVWGNTLDNINGNLGEGGRSFGYVWYSPLPGINSGESISVIYKDNNIILESECVYTQDSNDSRHNYCQAPWPEDKYREIKAYQKDNYIFTFRLTLSEFIRGRRPVVKDVYGSYTPRPTLIQEDISNWKTYKNEKYGFEFKYPWYWPHQLIEKRSDGYYISKMYDQKFTLNILSKSYEGIKVEKLFSAELNDGTFIKGNIYSWCKNLSCEDEDMTKPRIILISLSGTTLSEDLDLEFSFNRSDEAEAILLFTKILSTFKFIDSTNASTWKTYQDNEYGFEIKIPQDWSTQNVQADILFLSSLRSASTENSDSGMPAFPWDIRFSPKSNIANALKDSIKNKVIGQNAFIFYFSKPSGGFDGPATYEIAHNGRTYRFELVSETDKIINQILSTFKFIEPNIDVICTQDAKQCPDGSYVGRTGPNCEFVCPK